MRQWITSRLCSLRLFTLNHEQITKSDVLDFNFQPFFWGHVHINVFVTWKQKKNATKGGVGVNGDIYLVFAAEK